MFSFNVGPKSTDRTSLHTSSPALLGSPRSSSNYHNVATTSTTTPSPPQVSNAIPFHKAPSSPATLRSSTPEPNFGNTPQQPFSFGSTPPFGNSAPVLQLPSLPAQSPAYPPIQFGPAASNPNYSQLPQPSLQLPTQVPQPPQPPPISATNPNAALYQLVLLLQQQQVLQSLHPQLGAYSNIPNSPLPPVPPAYSAPPPTVYSVPSTPMSHLVLPTPTSSVSTPSEVFTPISPGMDAISPMQSSPTPFDYVTPTSTDSSEGGSTKSRSKRQKRTSEEVTTRTVLAQKTNRPRDSAGKFLPRKMQKTDLRGTHLYLFCFFLKSDA